MALDIAGRQILAQPVTSMYKGRALRQAEQAADLNMRLGEQEFELNKARLASIGQPDPKEQREAQKHRADMAKEFLSSAREIGAQALSTYESLKDLPEESRLAASQAVWSRGRKMIADTYGEQFGIQFDEDATFTPEEARARLQTADDLLKSMNGEVDDSAFSPINPKDYTPESVSEFQRTKDYSVLRKADGDGGDSATSGQRLAAGFAVRTQDSGEVLSLLGDQFVGFTSRLSGARPEGWKSDDRQRFDQATRDFINATLRRESGAAIAESEFENVRQ
jgi:hypothetical protein